MIEKTFELMLLIVASMGIVSIVLASIYDIKKIRREPTIREAVHRLTKRFQPHVTIITQADNILELHAHLRQIAKIHYKQYDVVAVTSRCTLAERRSLCSVFPAGSLRVYTPRNRQYTGSTIASAYRLSKRGEMVVLLGEHDRLEAFAIKRSVAILQESERVESLRFMSELQPVDSMMGLYNAFAELSSRTFGKACLAAGIPNRRPVGHSGTYRSKVLLHALKTATSLRTVDSRALAASGSSSVTLTSNPRWSAWFGRFALIVFVVYAAVAAALLQNALLLLLLWVIVSIWLLAIIWSENTERVASRLALSVCVPIGMFVIVSAYIAHGVLAPFHRRVL